VRPYPSQPRWQKRWRSGPRRPSGGYVPPDIPDTDCCPLYLQCRYQGVIGCCPRSSLRHFAHEGRDGGRRARCLYRNKSLRAWWLIMGRYLVIAGCLAALAARCQADDAAGKATKSVSAYNNPMSESAFNAFLARPVPAVRVEDLRRVWSFMASEPSQAQAQRSLSLSMVAGLCGPKADPLAVSFRAALIQALLRRGRLDRWRNGSTLQNRVFEVAAKFSLPKGPAEADLDALAAAIE